MTDPDYAAACAIVRGADSVICTSHLNPDADGIATALALALACERLGKPARVVLPSPAPRLYAFLPGFARVSAVADAAAARRQPPCALLIACDCGDRERLGAAAALPHQRLLNLDHHASNTRFGDLALVDEEACCSGLVAARLLEHLGVPLDRELATLLYATLVYDTGRFLHPNTTAEAFRFAARLAEAGVDIAAVNRALTYTRSPRDLGLLKLALERLTIDAEVPGLAGIALTRAELAALGEPEEWSEIIEIPRSLADNRIAYLVREPLEGAGARISLRSVPPYDVAAVAAAFGGGGHRQAAGATYPGTAAACLAELLPRLRALLADARPAP
ncbi:MAG: DHH family phosphoesterase [Planctomycetota bacterium]|nr:DHH family phosphoesterase [Planctomycetota bacterium]